MVVATRTDIAGLYEWHLHDEVIRLRQRGTRIIHPLPPTPGTSLIGAAGGCWLQLSDPSGYVSRRHAALTYRDNIGWSLSDAGSKNGIYRDGVRVSSLILVPGLQIRLGSITLVAESPRICALRELLARVIGWGDDRLAEVDQALYAVRTAATHREPLLLCGPGNLVSIARLLHRQVVGERPFVIWGGRATYASGRDALAAAAGGTLCVQRTQQPADFEEMVAALRASEARVLLVVCAPTLARTEDIASQILIPPLADRAGELDQIVDAYAHDAITSFGGWLSPMDRGWIAEHASGTLTQIEIATRRIVALHACGESITPAARLLAMSHGALSDWASRRRLPGRSAMPAMEDDDA